MPLQNRRVLRRRSGRAALMFARVRAGIKAGNPFPRVTGVRMARIDYNLLCLAERRSEAIPSQGAVKGSFQKEGVTLMIRLLLLSVLTCTLLLWNAGARAETKPSPNAVVKCGRLAGLKGLPGWQTPAIYKIEGNKVTFERIPTSGDETEAWSGVKGQSGQIMLVGVGGNKSDQWVMEFSGKWAGGNKTKLTGKFTNTSGSSGYRICTINL
jgi:hypothetical protein